MTGKKLVNQKPQKQTKEDKQAEISSIISSKMPSRLKEVVFNDLRYTYKGTFIE